jgi:hypothetical protein
VIHILIGQMELLSKLLSCSSKRYEVSEKLGNGTGRGSRVADRGSRIVAKRLTIVTKECVQRTCPRKVPMTLLGAGRAAAAAAAAAAI